MSREETVKKYILCPSIHVRYGSPSGDSASTMLLSAPRAMQLRKKHFYFPLPHVPKRNGAGPAPHAVIHNRFL